MHYYGTRLSENISRRPEGYLLCLNVPVARSGTQEYLPEELGMPAPATGPPTIPVYRPEEEVFSSETIASFEGMPVTNDHPVDGVSIENIRALQKGHAQNVRRGSGDDADLLLADLMITDERLIHLIMDEGKREISCGYTYELCEENGQYVQRKIRGNHIAVVDAGRAGPRVSIKDEEPCKSPICGMTPTQQSGRTKGCCPRVSQNDSERRTFEMKKSLYRKLLRMARDGDPEALEAIAEVTEALLEPDAPDVHVTVVNEEPVAPVVAAPAATAPVAAPMAVAPALPDPSAIVETAEGNEVVVDGDTLSEILTRLDRLIEIMTAKAESGETNPPLEALIGSVPDCGGPGTQNQDEDVVEEMIEAIEEEMEATAAVEEILPEIMPETTEETAEAAVEEILSSVLEPKEEEASEDAFSRDRLRTAMNKARPRFQQLTPAARKRAAADIAAMLKKKRKPATDSSVAQLISLGSAAPEADYSELGKKIMEKRNPNYHV